MKKPVFTGAAVAIITPFKSTGEVDYEEFGKIIDHQIAHGTDAIVVWRHHRRGICPAR